MSSEWEEKILSELADINPKRYIQKGCSAPFIEMSALPTNSRDISASKIVSRIYTGGGSKFKNGDTLLARITPCLENGKTALVSGITEDKVAHGSTEFIVIGPKLISDAKFLFYLARSEHFRSQMISRMEGTSGRQRVPIGAASKYKFFCPPAAQREKIGEIIGVLDDNIENLRETNTTLEAIAQALFKSWFVDFDPVRAKAKGRQPEGMDAGTAALFPDSFEEYELGLIPSGWRISSMDEIADVGIGKTPPRKETQWFSENNTDIRWVSIRDMGVAGAFISQTSEYLTTEAVEKYNIRLVPDNTVLLSFKMTIGRVALTDGEMTTNEAIAHFKLNKMLPLKSEYIYLYLKQFNYTSLSSTSSIADAVNSKTVKSIPILVPDHITLGVFHEKVGVIFKRIESIVHQIHTLATLRDILLPRLISGQLQLPKANAVIKEAAL